MSKPIIGLNADFVNRNGRQARFHVCRRGLLRRDQQGRRHPAHHSAAGRTTTISSKCCDQLDGVVLVGGADLDPRRDGWMLHPTIRPLATRREAFDRRLMRLIAERRHAGVRHRRRHAAAERRRWAAICCCTFRKIGRPRCRTTIRSTRPIATRWSSTPGSLMERVYGDGELRVNSMHHMAIDEVAPGFEVTARCPDGIVEAIESRMPDWFALGTQFHPEADTASAPRPAHLRRVRRRREGIGRRDAAGRLKTSWLPSSTAGRAGRGSLAGAWRPCDKKLLGQCRLRDSRKLTPQAAFYWLATWSVAPPIPSRTRC